MPALQPYSSGQTSASQSYQPYAGRHFQAPDQFESQLPARQIPLAYGRNGLPLKRYRINRKEAEQALAIIQAARTGRSGPSPMNDIVKTLVVFNDAIRQPAAATKHTPANSLRKEAGVKLGMAGLELVLAAFGVPGATPLKDIFMDGRAMQAGLAKMADPAIRESVEHAAKASETETEKRTHGRKEFYKSRDNGMSR